MPISEAPWFARPRRARSETIGEQEVDTPNLRDRGVTTEKLADGALPATLTTHANAADPHAGYLLESLIDAKGDIIAGTADNIPGRLAAGANGQFLTYQSGQATGLLPATHDSTGDPHTQYQRESEKGAASGYASLGSDTLALPAEMGTRTAVRARQATLQSMATGWNIIAYETEDEDVLSEYNITNYRFTPATTGWYVVTMGLTMAFGAAGRILLSLGNTAAGGEIHRLFDATSFGAAATGLFKLTAATSYTAQMNNASGAAANTTPGGAYCFLNIRRLPNAT